jgi:hypothetical protein
MLVAAAGESSLRACILAGALVAGGFPLDLIAALTGNSRVDPVVASVGAPSVSGLSCHQCVGVVNRGCGR